MMSWCTAVIELSFIFHLSFDATAWNITGLAVLFAPISFMYDFGEAKVEENCYQVLKIHQILENIIIKLAKMLTLSLTQVLKGTVHPKMNVLASFTLICPNKVVSWLTSIVWKKHIYSMETRNFLVTKILQKYLIIFLLSFIHPQYVPKPVWVSGPHSIFSIQWRSMGTNNCLVMNILENIFFCA